MQALIDEAIHDEDFFTAAVYRAKIDPDWFCNSIIRMPNDPWQSELMNAVADLDRIRLGIPTLYNHKGLNRFTVSAFHGPGKTHVMAKLAQWWNFTRKGRIPCTAPKLDQLKTRLWPELRKQKSYAIDLYKDIIKVDRTAAYWFDDEDWCMIAESASQPDNLAGHHDDWLMYLVEEASGVDEIMWPAIEGALSTPTAVLIIIGNPIRSSGEFWASHNKKGTKELYYQIRIKPSDSPRISKDWVNGMVKKYGRNSPVVKSRVFGEFVTMEEGQIFDQNWLETQHLPIEKESDGSIAKIRISIDVADGGIDETVFTIFIHYQAYVVGLRLFRRSYDSETAVIDAVEDAEQFFKDFNGNKARDEFVVDSLGVGAGTAQLLIKKGYKVIKYKGGEDSDDKKKWRNRRVQSHMVARDAVREGWCYFNPDFCDGDDWEDFLAQCCSIKQKPNADRVEDLMTKAEMKAKGIKSPDMAESWIMQFATQQPIEESNLIIAELESLETA